MSTTQEIHDGASHGSLRTYVVGFCLAVVLTVISFALTMTQILSASMTLAIVVALGLIQIVVHLIYFLHMNGSSDQSWNTVALVFSVVIVSLVVTGSLWIMYHLDTNMMMHIPAPD